MERHILGHSEWCEFAVQSDLSHICINSPSVLFIHAQAPEQVLSITDYGAHAKAIDFLSKHSDEALVPL